MKYAWYKCPHCGQLNECGVSFLKDFPSEIPCEKCHIGCCPRVYSPVPSIVHQGKCGNHKNGYTSNSVKILKS